MSPFARIFPAIEVPCERARRLASPSPTHETLVDLGSCVFGLAARGRGLQGSIARWSGRSATPRRSVEVARLDEVVGLSSACATWEGAFVD